MKKILIADDDVDILTLMEAMLSIHRFKVQTVSNWQHIDSSVAQFEPDLILLDISLGGADGRDICKTIKEAEATQHIPLILFSANAEMGRNIEQYHAQAFIAKPFHLSSLLKTIGSYLA
ncbi:MAG TPA: response regulator [Panacibacter sp.]|nr:response regulator [Panacibacter sp.]HNP46448.1 response regulator [Panacibacter sp.]